jgi:hypothetical protein
MHRDIAQGRQANGRPAPQTSGAGQPPLQSLPVHREFDPSPSHQANLGRSAINVAGGCIFRDTGWLAACVLFQKQAPPRLSHPSTKQGGSRRPLRDRPDPASPTAAVRPKSRTQRGKPTSFPPASPPFGAVHSSPSTQSPAQRSAPSRAQDSHVHARQPLTAPVLAALYLSPDPLRFRLFHPNTPQIGRLRQFRRTIANDRDQREDGCLTEPLPPGLVAPKSTSGLGLARLGNQLGENGAGISQVPPTTAGR